MKNLWRQSRLFVFAAGTLCLSLYPQKNLLRHFNGSFITPDGRPWKNITVIFRRGDELRYPPDTGKISLQESDGRRFPLEIRGHDPLAGNFLVRSSGYESDSEIFILTAENIVSYNPVLNFPEPRGMIKVNRFEIDIDTIVYTKNNKLTAVPVVISWNDDLAAFARQYLNRYESLEALERIILICGFADSGEKGGNTLEQKKLAMSRADFIYNFFVNNFNFPGNSFILTVDPLIRDASQKPSARVRKHSHDRKVEIRHSLEIHQ